MIKEHAEGVSISLHILPNAPRTEIIGLHGNHLKIKIKAPPVDGKANEEIIKFFSRYFEISRNRCEILRGEKSKSKVILLRGLTLTAVQNRLPHSNS